MRKGYRDIDAALPDAATVMLRTRSMNDFLHTHYTMDEVAAMDPLWFTILGAVHQGLFPEPVKK